MSKRGHTEEQTLRALHQADGGTRISDLCREQRDRRSDVLRLEEEVRWARTERVARTQAVAGGEPEAQAAGRGSLAGPAHAARDRPKKAVRPRHRRELGRWTQAAFVVSERRVSRLLPIQLATLRYRSRRDPQTALRIRLRELAANRVRFGYRRLTALLRREGWKVNGKRIYRIYTEDGLAVRTKLRRKIARRQRVPLLRATRPHERLSMDFVSNRLLDGC
jgi:putative transposase